MTDAEKLNSIKALMGITDNNEDAVLNEYLSLAKNEIISWRYSYTQNYGTPQFDITAVPPEYEQTQIFAVINGFSMAGAEGESVHNENGINRTFVYADMVKYIRSNVIPINKVYI